MSSPRTLRHKVSTVVDDETKEQLSKAARQEERSEGSIVRRALRAYLRLNGAEQ